MRTLVCFASLCLAAVSVPEVAAQTIANEPSSISIQPILWLDSLVPNDLTGVSAQYETASSNANSFAVRAVWFRDPLYATTSSRSNGYAISLEYRHYLSSGSRGIHVGPFAEWIEFEYLGTLRVLYGSTFRSLFDVGATAGYKWVDKRLVFDISLRTSWYSPASYPRSGYFPRMQGSHYNSFLILSVGYSLE